ncbi:MAG: hypothetical protein H0T42_11925 [Deltaproteobacteria bacterium]|nr:hypothetical protein [Deltaproteobacteria bacterium]
MRSSSILLVFTVACVSRAEKPPAAPGPPELAWKTMSRDQRMTYMEKVVVPEMKPLFVAIDPKRFADFGCRTCHGASFDDKTFEMPNPALLKLPATPAGMIPLARDKGPWLDAMTTRIKPKMARLLGLAEYDVDHPQPDAFGCHGCHRVE